MQLHMDSECVLLVADGQNLRASEVRRMSDTGAQVETCLAELHRELDKLSVLEELSVTVLPLRDRYGRECLEVHDRQGAALRIHVFPELFWYVWGADVEERHSVFHPAESARLIVAAISEGRPAQFTLDAFFR
jgi:hypothetical protein